MSIETAALTRAEVAWLLNMSDSWVRDRMQAGDLPRPGATAEEYVQAFLEYRMRKVAAADGSTGLNYDAERARLTKEQADKVATSNAIDRKELASLPNMTLAVTSVITLAMSRLSKVPALVAKGDEKLRLKIETALGDALEELSLTRVEEAMGGGLDEEAEPEDDDD